MSENNTIVEETPKKGLAHKLYTGEVSYDFMAARKKWFSVLGGLVVVSILLIIFRGLTLGIEFKGGTDFQAPVHVQASTIEDVREATTKFRVKELGAQVFSIGDSAVRVQTRSLAPDEITTTREDLANVVGATADDVTYNTIGGSWGAKISKDAGIAVGVFIALVMVLIAVYFRDWRMAVAAIIALSHDMFVTLGVYSLVGFTMTPSTLIGILTILGYSLYDTVVVFDKVKENTKHLHDMDRTYSQQANLAINQVLVRSINTTVIGVLPVLAMFMAGVIGNSDPLKDMGLALLVGMIAGAMSSIFIATPLLAWFKERTPAQREHRANVEKRLARKEARTVKVVHEESGERVVGAPPRQRRRTMSRAERKKKK